MTMHSYQTGVGRRRRGHRAYIIGRLILTTTNQPGHAPLADRCGGTVLEGEHEGRKYWGRAILLMPWRRQWGESLPQRALVVGWMENPRTSLAMLPPTSEGKS